MLILVILEKLSHNMVRSQPSCFDVEVVMVVVFVVFDIVLDIVLHNCP